MTKDTGGFAFPHVIEHLHEPVTAGMTLRDYFAAKAMVGLMSMQRAEEYVDDEGLPNYDETGTLFVHTEFLAEEAYMIADMMLKARKK
jgi:hypothetical protein